MGIVEAVELKAQVQIARKMYWVVNQTRNLNLSSLEVDQIKVRVEPGGHQISYLSEELVVHQIGMLLGD